MKKLLLSLLSASAMLSYAQSQTVTTHSVYDVNQNGEINVADAVSVAQATLQEADPSQTEQYVTGEELCTMFSTILSKLESLESRLTELENKQCNCSCCGGSECDDDPYNGHEYVDLGVVVDGKPVYWATTNIGADSPADAGLYFAWGETVGYGSSPLGESDIFGGIEIFDGHTFDWLSYSSDLCEGDRYKMKKYCTSSNYGTVDNKNVLDPEDDAAHVNWQGAWRMPTREELDALRDQCTCTWTTMANSAGEIVNGCKVSNKLDSSKYIFLPAVSKRVSAYIGFVGTYGYYWSSSLNTYYGDSAYYLNFSSYGNLNTTHDCRCFGYSVRPVCQ